MTKTQPVTNQTKLAFATRVLLVASMALLVALTALAQSPEQASAQRNAQASNTRIDVFLEQDAQTGAANVYFLDALSGLSVVVNTNNGEHFTLLGDYVIYNKRQSGAVMRANLNGTLEPHPFIRRSVDTQAVRWVVSPDTRAIAWVTISATGESLAYVAWADGSAQRRLPLESPGTDAVLAPLALANNMAHFIYDSDHRLADDSEPFMVYRTLAQYDFLAGEQRDLAGGDNCPCAATVDAGGRVLARLEAPGGEGPFALHVWDLPSGATTLIPAPDLPYHYGGDLILNENGTFAAYTVAAGVGEEANIRLAEYALVLVNIVAGEQYAILPPAPERFRPVAFIDEDNMLLLAGITTGGTYKLDLDSRELHRVSDLFYLGTVAP